jgi:cation diffusion facilitator CzcD-associated flavoprotein CzcO
VAVIGAGFSGIATGVNLVKRGIRTFTIFEKAQSPGGTWWYNQYPGAECDVPSALYCFSFKPHAWTRPHARQAEILAYLEETIDEYGIRPMFELGVAVQSAVWHEDRQQYLVTLESGRTEWFDVVISAVGMLSDPSIPDWPGLGDFRGQIVHSSRWDPSLDVAGKRVAVIGNGASAAQILPQLQPQAGHLLSFQREPAWIAGKAGDHEYTEEELAELARVGRRRRLRWETLKGIDNSKKRKNRHDPELSAKMRAYCEGVLAKAFEDRPEMLPALTPTYDPKCKRLVASNTFYPALKEPNVTLVPRAVAAVTPTGIVDAQGEEHEVDVIVAATGFRAAEFLSTLEIVGRDGRSIQDHWAGSPEAYLGITVPGFPNFYMQYGPNTHGTVVTFVVERQAEFAARDVRRLARAGGGSIEVRASVNRRFQRRLQAAIDQVEVWKSGCHNYYLSATGQNVVQWPWTHIRYWLAARATRVASSRLRRLTDAHRAARARPPAPEAPVNHSTAAGNGDVREYAQEGTS